MRTETSLVGRFAERWITAVVRHARLTVIAAILFTAVMTYYTASNIGISTDTTDMLSPDLPFRQSSKAIDAAFPQFSDNIAIVIDGANQETIDDAAARLVAALRAESHLFGSVFDPAGDSFFRQNGLLYLSRPELEELADRLAEAQPFLGTLARDPSISGLVSVLELAVDDWSASDEPAPAEGLRLVQEVTQQLLGFAAGRPGQLSWRDAMFGDDASPGPRIIVLDPRVDFSGFQPGAASIERIREIASGLGLNQKDAARVRLTGSLVLSQEELNSVADGMGIAAVVSIVLVFSFLVWGLRSWQLIVGTLFALVFGLISTAAFATLAIGQLNLISVAFAVLFIGLSVDFGIHYTLAFQEQRKGSAHPHGYAGKLVSDGLFLAAVAAAIGFLSFLPTDYRGLAELGIISGAGMFIALFANLTVLPGALAVLPPSTAAQRTPEHRRRTLPPGPSLAFAGFLAAVAVLIVPSLRFDFDPLNLQDPTTESVSTVLDLAESPSTTPYSAVVLAASDSESEQLKRRFEQIPSVRSVRSVGDLVPGGQDSKLEIISDLALFIGPSLAAATVNPSRNTNTALADLTRKLSGTAGGSNPELAAALAGLRSALEKLGTLDAARSADLQKRLLGTLPAQLALLGELLNAEEVSLSDVPEGIRSRIVASDGRVRVEVQPEKNLRDPRALQEFVEDIRRVAPNAAGTPIVIFEAARTVIRAFIEAAVISMVLVALLIIAVIREVRGIVLVLVPLSLAALLTMATAAFLELPLNFANIIVLPLLFGLGVASGIHLITRERNSRDTPHLMATSTPRAVTFSALTTLGSFASIALSSHPGTSSMGVLLTIAIIMILFTMLVVLPAMMALWPARRR